MKYNKLYINLIDTNYNVKQPICRDKSALDRLSFHTHISYLGAIHKIRDAEFYLFRLPALRHGMLN